MCCSEEAGGGRREVGLSGPAGHETITVLMKMNGEQMLLKALLNSCWAALKAAPGFLSPHTPFLLTTCHTQAPHAFPSRKGQTTALPLPFLSLQLYF